MGIVVVTEPESEPLSLVEAKAQLRTDDDAEDSLIEGLIVAARRYCELRLGTTLIETELRLTLDRFPCRLGRLIELPRGPLVSVDAVTYYDSANALQTLAEAAYDVDATSRPGRLLPAIGATWPATYGRLSAVQIDFTAGHASAAAVPRTIRHAMLMLIAHWFENREAVGSVGGKVELAVESLLSVEWDGSYALAGHDG